MTCIIETMPARQRRRSLAGLWHKLFIAFVLRKRNHMPRLHPDELSDHLKRDLGFLDGRS